MEPGILIQHANIVAYMMSRRPTVWRSGAARAARDGFQKATISRALISFRFDEMNIHKLSPQS
jgi:hypothetical protein